MSIRIVQFWVLLGLFTYLALSEPGTHLAPGVDDFVLHLGGYVILFWSGVLAYPVKGRFLVLGLFLFAYSVVIEIIQFFIPFRAFGVIDIVANALGLLVGAATAYGSIRAGWVNRPEAATRSGVTK